MGIEGVVDILRSALLLTLTVSAPLLVVALLLGVVISMLQAVTQIQEQTLSFVPKLLAILLVGALMIPWALGQMIGFMTRILMTLPLVAG